MMRKIVQLIPKGRNSALAVSGVSTIFRMAQSHGLPLEYAVLSAQDSKMIQMDDFTLQADEMMKHQADIDLIIIPSLVGDPSMTLSQNEELIDWLKQMREKDTQIASLCTGAYLLAATHLLDGHEASSHFAAIDDLRQRFPLVKWMPEKIITDRDGMYTSGGTLSAFNLLIYLLGKYFDKSSAHRIAKIIQIDYPRKSQKPFYILSNQKNHADEQILQIQQYLEQHVNQSLNLNQLARQFGLSRRSLNRRFKAATGDHPLAYIQKTKVEQAKAWLEKEDITINEVIYKIGYNDGPSFRKIFKRITGMLPNEYKQKFAS